MQINKLQNISGKTETFNGFLNSKFLTKSLEFASDNGALFAAGTTLVCSSLIRPLAILATPKAEKENKQYACAKSIASSITGFAIMAIVSKPIVQAVKNISRSPKKYLSSDAVKTLKDGTKTLANSSKFQFVSKIFKLGAGFITAFPKAFLTCALIPLVMAFFFKKNKDDSQKAKNSQISFAGRNINNGLYQKFTHKLSEKIGKIINLKPFLNFAKKYHETNIAQHMFSANDILVTGLFVKNVKSNKNIKESRKKTLIYNASIATIFTIIGGYAVNKMLDKPTQKFVEKFKAANINSPKLAKYLDGIKVAKPALILSILYYLITPIVSTMLAETATTKNS